MLRELTIENLALVDRLDLDFSSALNIITGETGAGKSIIVGAIKLLLGDRADTNLIRKDKEKLRVEGVIEFKGDVLKEIAGEDFNSGDELILCREIYSSGRSSAFINGRRVPVQMLRELSSFFIDLHSQHEYQSLLHVEKHLLILDAYGRLTQNVKETESLYQRLKNLENAILNKKKTLEEIRQKQDFYKFQIKEIMDAGLKPAEDEELLRENDILSNLGAIREKVESIFGELQENENSAVERLGSSLNSVKWLSNIDNRFEELSRLLETALTQVQEVADFVAKYRSGLEFDPMRLEKIQERLSRLESLKRKYGTSISGILDYLKKIQEELALLDSSEFDLELMEKEYQAILNELKASALRLSSLRQSAGNTLAEEVSVELADLGMRDARFMTNIRRKDALAGLMEIEGKKVEVSANGIDRVEFYIETNQGEGFKPLSQTASGGEISRIMLCLKKIFAEVDKVPTLVFDEVDAGIGGTTVKKIGEKIKFLSNSHQIICITHLPQIASLAHRHFMVSKETTDGRTVSRISELHGESRADEIARMLGGGRISELTKKHALELLANVEDELQGGSNG